MDAINLLFGSWTGILTIFTVLFATAFIVYMIMWAWKKSGEAQ